MSAIEAILGGPLAQAIGWALVHLVWQGVVVAGILGALLALMQRRSSQARYLVSCAAMLLLLALATATAIRAYQPGDALAPAPAVTAPAALADSATNQPSNPAMLLAQTRNYLPTIVFLWIVGVAALSVRLAGGWLRAQRLAKRSASPAADEWQRTVARLSDALGLRRGIRLLHSAAVEVPTVLGWIRPVILLPMTLSGLSPEQVEMILAHELAHIRRHDFLVNLMQAVVETLLFYHPAVWWISARVRIEREHCCDDAAIAVCGNPLQYARALTRLEELRADAGRLALAANGGSLLARIRRVAGIRSEAPSAPSRWFAGAALLTVVVALLIGPSLPMFARDQETPPPPPAPPAAPKAPPATPAAPAIAGTPAPPAAPPAIAQSRIEVHADANADDDVDIEVPDPPEPPEPPEQPEPTPHVTPAPHATTPRPAPPAAPRQPACPGEIDVHIPALKMPKMVMPKIEMGPMDIHIDQQAIADGVRDAVEAQRKAMRDLERHRGSMEIERRALERSMHVDKSYLDGLKGAGLTVTEREAWQLRMMGVTPRYVKSLREAGLKKLTVHDVVRLRSMGITADFLKELRRMQQ
jgi:beta-lactamase regulating signal transducer with metallopeptidase domain